MAKFQLDILTRRFIYNLMIVTGAGQRNVLTGLTGSIPAPPCCCLKRAARTIAFDFRTQMPAALAFPLQGKRYNWAYETEPEPFMNNRRMECGRGQRLVDRR